MAFNKNKDLRQCVIDELNVALGLQLTRYDVRKCKRFGPQSKKPRTVLVQVWDEDIKHNVLAVKKNLIGGHLRIRDYLPDHILELVQCAYVLKNEGRVFGVWGTRKGVFGKLSANSETFRIKDAGHVESLRKQQKKSNMEPKSDAKPHVTVNVARHPTETPTQTTSSGVLYKYPQQVEQPEQNAL